MSFDRDSQEQIDSKDRFLVGLLAFFMFIGVSFSLIAATALGHHKAGWGTYIWLGLNLWAALYATGIPWKRTALRMVGLK